MALISARNLGFRYAPALGQTSGRAFMRGVEPATKPEEASFALRAVNLEVEDGAFCVISGPSGCGKSTLLRLLKPEIAPRGTCEGELVVGGRALVRNGAYDRTHGDMCEDAYGSASPLVAFVAQDPEAQIVCDTVRAELAFGLENLGAPPAEMTRRIAEAAGFLGLDAWMSRSTAQLSGGEKQLLNLASALALHPRILVLDEPTAQLDPYACRRLLAALASIRHELGLTIVIASHAPALFAPFATQHFTLQPAREAQEQSAPSLAQAATARKAHAEASRAASDAPLIELRRIAFRYGARAPWTIEDASLSLHPGSIHALVGANGSGKSTLLKIAAGILKPTRGRRIVAARPALGATHQARQTDASSPTKALRQAYLPQDPKALFACDTVREELWEWQRALCYGTDEVARIVTQFALEPLLEQHPYDLSGGQQQRLALAKLMLGAPQALFLDEPTKGLDATATAEVGALVQQAAAAGCAVLVATHDVALIDAIADVVSLVFDGGLACTLPTAEFFAGSLVYQPPSASAGADPNASVEAGLDPFPCASAPAAAGTTSEADGSTP